MEAGFIVALVLGVVIGVVIGMFIRRSDGDTDSLNGTLNVSYNELYDGYDLFLNLQVPVEDIVNQKRVKFDVNVMRPYSPK